MPIDEKPTLACTTCAKAKCRCIPGPAGDSKCERCHRLGKECKSREPAPRRIRKPAKRSRVALLEKRLSELEGGNAAKLALQADSTSPASFDDERATSESAPLHCPILGLPPKGSESKKPPMFHHLFLPEETATPWPSKDSVTAGPTRRPPWDSMWPMQGEAEAMLAEYRSKAARLFPFIVLPEIKASELKEQRPFLWKAVMIVACFLDGARHDRLGEELINEIVTATMMKTERSLDILQGLQLLVAWFHMKSSRLMNLLFLARSMCLGLGLSSSNMPNPSDAPTRNLDALRAYAGTYYVNTLVFTTNKISEVLMNTVYLDRCCSVLEGAKQYESDELLVKLVRVQQVAQSISLTLSMEPSQQPMQLPMTMVVHSFQDQINALRESLSPNLAANAMLESHMSIAEILLTEWAISDRHCNDSNMTLTDRLRLLWTCVRSLKSVFSVRMRIWNDYGTPHFLCMHSFDLSCALLTAVRLVTLRLPGWDLERIEHELAFRDVMDSVIAHLAGVVDVRRNGLYSTALLQGPRHGDDSMATKDPIAGLLNLCSSLSQRVRAEMDRALADCQDGDAVYQAPHGTVGDLDELGDAFWKDFVIDGAWTGSGNLDDFIMQ